MAEKSWCKVQAHLQQIRVVRYIGKAWAIRARYYLRKILCTNGD
uniref:Uncharacterized protein n=1 Tax=Arundo donax TaxID=35708 RepID=A0A0A9HND8_ARUDO